MLFYCCSSGNLLTYNKVFVFLAGVKRALWSLQAVRQGLHSLSTTKNMPQRKQSNSVLRWNSWTAFLVKVSGHKLESSHTRIFVWFSTLIFPFYIMLFMNRLELSCFAGLFARIIKTRDVYGFLSNQSVEGTVYSMQQKTRVFCEIDV